MPEHDSRVGVGPRPGPVPAGKVRDVSSSGVPLSMNRTCPAWLDAHPSDRSVDAEVSLRQEPDEEEDDEEDEDDGKHDAEDDDPSDDGYSE